MKLRTIFSLGAIAALASTSFGYVWYDNGGPNLVDGNEMTAWSQSEDLPFDAGDSFNRLVFWTLEAPTATLSTVSIRFSFDNGSGNPDFVAVSYLNLGLTTRTATGNTLAGLNEFMNVVDFTDTPESGSGIFHMELLGNEAANPNHDFQGIFWESTNANGSNKGRESLNNTRDNWFDNGVEHAFRLENNVVPEPASMAVLGLGVLVLLRRRRK